MYSTFGARMRGWADKGGALFSIHLTINTSNPPYPSPSFLCCIFPLPRSTLRFPSSSAFFLLIDHPLPRCLLTYISPSSRLCSTHIDLFYPYYCSVAKASRKRQKEFSGRGLARQEEQLPGFSRILFMAGSGASKSDKPRYICNWQQLLGWCA